MEKLIYLLIMRALSVFLTKPTWQKALLLFFGGLFLQFTPVLATISQISPLLQMLGGLLMVISALIGPLGSIMLAVIIFSLLKKRAPRGKFEYIITILFTTVILFIYTLLGDKLACISGSTFCRR